MADAILYYDESEDELAYDQGAAFFLALLGLDADLATLSLPASTTISAFGASLVDDAAATNARDTLELGTSHGPTFDHLHITNQGDFSTVHTTTILADHVGEHTGAHGVVFDNDLSRVGKLSIDHIAEATGAHGVVFDHTPAAATIKLTNLTDDYIPYHVDDSTGLANGPTKTNVDSAVSLKHTQHTDTGTTGNTFTVDSDSTTGKIIIDVALGAADKSLTITNTALTDNRSIVFPDASGTVSLGGGSAHVIQEEGSPLTARANLNFKGAGVVAADDAGNDATTVTISGSSVADITDIPTAEMDDSLVLAPDGAGGVEFRAEVGGSGLTVADLQKYGLM